MQRSADPPTVNIKFLRTFLALVEERSTVKTAKRLSIAKASVPDHIARIEAMAGARLLEQRFPPNREERGRTQLTEAGRKFLPKAIEALRAHDRLFDDAPMESDPREANRILAMHLMEATLAALRHDLSDDDRQRLYDTLLG